MTGSGEINWETTPGAGPSRLQAPVTPKPRRRSWFHFGSSSSTPPPPLPTSEIQEELELSPLTPRQSKDSTRIPVPADDDVLDINGHLEPKSTKAKKKKRSKGGAKDEEGEVVRMMDLKPPVTARRGSASGSDTSSRTELGIGTVRSLSAPRLVNRILTTRHLQKGHSQGQQVIERMLRTSSILHLVNPHFNNRDSTVPPPYPPTRTRINLLFPSKDLCPHYRLQNARPHPQRHLLGSTSHRAVQFGRLTNRRPR